MEQFLTILIALSLCFGFLRLCLVPMKWFWKIVINSLCGFACLWLLNLISAYTGITLEINLVTCLFTGFLGTPGIILLVLGQML